MKPEETRENLEASDVDAAVVALMQLLKRMNIDLVVGLKLLEEKTAKDRVTGAGLSISEQKSQLRLRAQKQKEILSRFKNQLEKAQEGQGV